MLKRRLLIIAWSVYIYLCLYNKWATIVNTRQRGLIRDSTLGVNTTGNRTQKIVIAVLRTHQETETEDPKIHGVRIYLLQFDHNEVFNVEQCWRLLLYSRTHTRNVHECASAPRIQQRKSVAAASSFVTRSVAAFGRRFTVLIEQTHIVQKCKRVFGESCQIQHCHAATVFNNKKVRSHCCLAITCVFGCVCTRACMHAYMRACVCTSYWQILLPSS